MTNGYTDTHVVDYLANFDGWRKVEDVEGVAKPQHNHNKVLRLLYHAWTAVHHLNSTRTKHRLQVILQVIFQLLQLRHILTKSDTWSCDELAISESKDLYPYYIRIISVWFQNLQFPVRQGKFLQLNDKTYKHI